MWEEVISEDDWNVVAKTWVRMGIVCSVEMGIEEREECKSVSTKSLDKTDVKE